MIAASYERKSGERASVARLAESVRRWSASGWRFLTGAGVMFLTGVVRAVPEALGRRRNGNGSVSQRWLAAHRADAPPE